jgi:hypothetical protein
MNLTITRKIQWYLLNILKITDLEIIDWQTTKKKVVYVHYVLLLSYKTFQKNKLSIHVRIGKPKGRPA